MATSISGAPCTKPIVKKAWRSDGSSAGADASVIDAMKRSSLHWAALAPEADKALSVLQLLFEHASSSGAAASQINHQTKSGATPLHCACSSNRVEMARFLLERGADPNLEDDDGKTCAALAKESGMPKDLFGGGRGRRDSKSSKGGFFARMRRASLGGSLDGRRVSLDLARADDERASLNRLTQESFKRLPGAPPPISKHAQLSGEIRQVGVARGPIARPRGPRRIPRARRTPRAQRSRPCIIRPRH